MAERIPWDKYETVLLLDTGIRVINNEIPRKTAIIELSEKLRNKAKGQGMNIDSVFRNENGISMQLTKMIGIIEEKEVRLHKPSKLFVEINDLYQNNKEEFKKLLREAKAMVEQRKNYENEFYNWLLNKIPPASLSEYFLNYKDIETFCLERNILKDKLFCTTDIVVLGKVKHTILENGLFRFKYKYRIKKMSICINYYITFVKEKTANTSSQIPYAVNETTSKTEEPESKGKKCLDSIEELDNVLTVNFADEENLAFTKPIYFTYFGEEFVNINNWTNLYVSVVKCLYDDYPSIFMKYLNRSFTGDNNRIDFGEFSVSGTMKAPKCISKGYYLETNLSANNIIRKIKELLDLCLVDRENLIIRYRKKSINQFRKDTKTETNTDNNVNAFSNDKDTVDFKQFSEILIDKFPKGYRIGSPLEFRKFKKYWEDAYGSLPEIDDDKILKCIERCGVLHEGKIYMPQKMLDDDTRTKLFSYINYNFKSGKSTIYYEALFKEFSDDFLDCCMYNTNMLRGYLVYMNDGTYYIHKKFISKDKNTSADPYDEIKACLQQQATPMEYSEMFERLSHIPEQKIKNILAQNNEFISNGRGEYFHISSVALSDDELNDIAEIIQYSIDEKQFISGKELIDSIKKKYPHIIDQNALISDKGLRDAIGYKLKSKFSFKGNIISSQGQSLSMMEVFADFCKHKESFTLDELKILKIELNTVIYFDAVYENSLRISKNEFVSKAQAKFRLKETDAAISRFCTGDYIAIKGINQFSLFPDAGFNWNSYLLEHYVAKYSPDYKLIHTNYNEGVCVGGIVKKISNIDTFDELVIDVLAKSGLPLQKETALQYLCDEGYLARRSYSGMEQLLIKAKELRNQKGY